MNTPPQKLRYHEEGTARPAPARSGWLSLALWGGVVITLAALPIGLLMSIPSVVISALGLTLVGVSLIPCGRARDTPLTPC